MRWGCTVGDTQWRRGSKRKEEEEPAVFLSSFFSFPLGCWKPYLLFGSFLSVDRLSLQHLVCRCIVFHRSLLLKNPQETRSLPNRRAFPRCWTSLKHLALVGSNEFWFSFAWIREKSLEKLIDGKIRSSFPEQTLPLCKLSRSTDRNDP